MKISTDKRLFWFFNDKTELNLENEKHLNMYVQQVLSYGRFEDVRNLLSTIDKGTFKKSFNRIKNFLPKEVKRFWERDYVG